MVQGMRPHRSTCVEYLTYLYYECKVYCKPYDIGDVSRRFDRLVKKAFTSTSGPPLCVVG